MISRSLSSIKLVIYLVTMALGIETICGHEVFVHSGYIICIFLMHLVLINFKMSGNYYLYHVRIYQYESVDFIVYGLI